MTDEILLVARADGSATVTLNRPASLNALTRELRARIATAFRELDADGSTRVAILTGAGRAFCAGLDLGGAKQGSTGMSGASTSSTISIRDTPPTVLHNMDTPVICALNGGAAGYGMDLAMGCDIRVMGEGGKLAAAFTKRGLLPESGGTCILPRLLGWAKAAELVFTGRTLGAADCLELGLVNQVVADADVQSAARALAEEIAANAPLAVRAAKRMMRMGLKEPFDEHVHHVFLQLLPLLKTEDFGEGIKAFLEKRAPVFTGK